MPELPEVETVVANLKEKIKGLTHKKVDVLWDKSLDKISTNNFISQSHVKNLWRAIREVVRAAVKNKGTNIGDGVWKYGGFKTSVYGRFGLSCPRCQEKIAKVKLAQRGTEFSPKCQG
jgi:formamidopyrimidine-DNA glycosylase